MLILAIYYEIVVVVHDSIKLADSMVDDKLFDEIFYLSVIICGVRLSLAVNTTFQWLSFCRRSGQAYL